MVDVRNPVKVVTLHDYETLTPGRVSSESVSNPPTAPFSIPLPIPSYLFPSFSLATLYTSLFTLPSPFNRTFLRDFLLRFTAPVAKLSCSQRQPLIPGIQSVLHQDGGCGEPSQSILHQDGGTQRKWSLHTIMKL